MGMKMNWFIYALFGMLALSAMFLLFRKLGNMGANSFTIIIFEFLIASIILVGYASAAKVNIIPTGNNIWYLLIAIGLLGAIGNILLTQSIINAPNPGYALAIVNANVVLVTIGAFFLFGSEVTITKGIGVALALAGIILIGL